MPSSHAGLRAFMAVFSEALITVLTGRLLLNLREYAITNENNDIVLYSMAMPHETSTNLDFGYSTGFTSTGGEIRFASDTIQTGTERRTNWTQRTIPEIEVVECT